MGEEVGITLAVSDLATLSTWNAGDSDRKAKSMAGLNHIVSGKNNRPCGGLPANNKTIFIEHIAAPFPLKNGTEIEAGTTFIHISKIVKQVSEPKVCHKTMKTSIFGQQEV